MVLDAYLQKKTFYASMSSLLKCMIEKVEEDMKESDWKEEERKEVSENVLFHQFQQAANKLSELGLSSILTTNYQE